MKARGRSCEATVNRAIARRGFPRGTSGAGGSRVKGFGAAAARGCRMLDGPNTVFVADVDGDPELCFGL